MYVEDVVNAVLAAVECDAGPELVATWISERYRELTNRTRCRHLLRHVDIEMPEAVTTGLVTATDGSDVLVGDTAARAAWAALGDAVLVDRHVRINEQRHWYRIAGRNGSGDLLLTANFVQGSTSDVSAVAYTLAQRYLELPTDLRHVGIITHPRLYQPLDEVSHQELDLAIAGRDLTADVPAFWAETEPSDDGTKRIEVYPYARTAQILKCSYYAVPPDLQLRTVVPTGIDPHVLKAGALVDVYRWEISKALKANQPDTAAVYTNLMNQQHTRWNDAIREAIKAERASEVATLFMPTGGFPSTGQRMIRDARDYVWSRGRRP